MKRPTILTVAKRAGVSKMTVSRVINDRPGVSDEVRKMVRNVIEELGYIPDARARSLALGRSNLIGILVPDIVSEWTTPLLLGVGEAAEELGYQVLLRSTGRGETFRPNAPDLLIESELTDGLIIASWRVPAPFIQKLVQRGDCVVMIDGFARLNKVPWVSSSDHEGAQEAVQHLHSIGHQHIGFIGGGEKSYLAQARTTGFLDGLESVGLNPNTEWILQGDFTLESGRQRALELLALKNRPTAIFAANDPMAMGVLQAAHEMGLSIPEDLSVVGFDNTLAAGSTPPLTTVERNYREMGRIATRFLADQISGNIKNVSQVQIDLSTRLVIRQSTASPTR